MEAITATALTLTSTTKARRWRRNRPRTYPRTVADVPTGRVAAVSGAAGSYSGGATPIMRIPRSL